MNSLTYLTRRCPRNCDYCNLHNAEGLGKELSPEQWIEAFAILKSLGIDFNLILGNETWLLGYDLLTIMQANEVPYALYTTCPPDLYNKYANRFFNGGIDNLSCGVDYSLKHCMEVGTEKNDMEKKSISGWNGLIKTKHLHKKVDCQGTVTVHRQNYTQLPDIVEDLFENDIFCGINFIHWNEDGNYDFFPSAHNIHDFLFQPSDMKELREVLNFITEHDNSVQNIEMLKEPVMQLTDMGWHCGGIPYGGPTIDSDGSLRCCGYRKGLFTPEYSIFDLPECQVEWQSSVFIDAMDCPGCFWSYPWMYKYWKHKDEKFGKDVFIKHAGKHIPKDKWSERKVQ